MMPPLNKRYLIGSALILFLIGGGFYRNWKAKNEYTSNLNSKALNSSSKKDWFFIEKFGLHSLIEITWSKGSSSEITVKQGIDSILAEMDAVFTETNKSHPFYILSHSPKGTSVKLSPHLHRLVKFYLNKLKGSSNKLSPLKLGAGEWVYRHRLSEDSSRLDLTPSIQDSIARLLQSSYYDYDTLQHTLSLKVDSLHLTTGCVSKGYGIMQLAHFLEQQGVKNYLINAGGDLHSNGHNKRGVAWTIGIQHPRATHNQYLGILQNNNPLLKGIATSGDYEVFYFKKGKRIHHLINGNTGEPISDKQSVTVLAKNGMLADFYATYFFLFPVKVVLQKVKKDSTLEVLIVDSQGKIHLSKGMKNAFSSQD